MQPFWLAFIALLSCVAGALYGFCAGIRNRLGPLKLDYKWAIGIYTGSDPLHLLPLPRDKNPVLETQHIGNVKACLIADPFLIRQGTSWHMFFEIVDAHTKMGSIGLAQSTDGVKWQYQKIVLTEPFHLSYPYTFQDKDSYYLVPETESQNSVRLYKAVDFPSQWKLTHILLSGRPFHDASVFGYQGRWWMFVGVGIKSDTLCLFFADDLLGPWQEHPLSPIVQANPHGARPGGRVLIYKDKMIRFSQETCPYYGKGLKAFEIVRLSLREYQEKEIPLPIPEPKKGFAIWNGYGMHHIDIQPTEDGRWLACADGQRRILSLDF